MQIQVDGITQAQRSLGFQIKPALKSATKAIAVQIEHEWSPYAPLSAANRPGGPGSRWYQRGYGPRWMRMDGSVGGRKTSQDMRHKWSVKGWGRIGAIIRNIATYSPYVHDDKYRARFHKIRGWVSDKEAVDKVFRSGVVERIIEAAIISHLRGRR